ncbi:MAG: InlB B-repeat-containing protein [Spirochaetia bacterium]|nr:InlB B-repeat-containing protein [Spirochaetia bacterium]MCF7941502.1 InlB B-repeat-containing protein [Spirochaetia bacterium]
MKESYVYILGVGLLLFFLSGCPIAETGSQVIYDGNGNTTGSVPVDTQTYDTNDSFTVLGNTGNLLRDGFLFVGWNSAADGTGESYGESDSVSMGTGDVTLFADWSVEPGIRAVAAGESFLLILKDDGTLWARGRNGNGELGDGTTTTRDDAVQIMAGTPVKAISAGLRHSMILTDAGDLYATGDNSSYQLGTGTNSSTTVPVLVRSSVAAVACGDSYTMIIDDDEVGTLLGVGHGTVDQAIGLVGDSGRVETFTQVDTGVTAVSAGNRHTLYLKDSTLHAMGNNQYGQLFLGSRGNDPVTPTATGYTNVRSISVGETHSLIVTTGDELWVVGSQNNGELGNGIAAEHEIPDNTALYYETAPSKLMDGVDTAEAGADVTMILKLDDTLWGVGSDYGGQQGDGDNVNSRNLAPVQVASGVHTMSVGEYHTSLWKIDGTVWDTQSDQNGTSRFVELSLMPSD